MTQSPNLSLSLIAPQQAQKHVTVNESLLRLDALVQLAVVSRAIAAEPAAPSDGDAYILPAGKTGAQWSAMADQSIAVFQSGSWIEIAPREGFLAFVADESLFYRVAGGNWGALSAGAAESAPKFGVNTAADDVNRLAVKSDATLFSHDDVTPGAGDHKAKINKSAPAKTASLVFQDAFSGRAEIGLTGSDDLSVKVSADGAAWKTPVTIDKTTGEVVLNATGANAMKVKTISDTANVVIAYQDASPSQQRIGAFNFLKGDGLSIGQIAYQFNNATPANQYMHFSVNSAVRLKIHGDGSVVIGAPTGGAKGAGTLNAQAVYDDNALLSCYVFDQAVDGAINLSKWDAKAPDGRHDGARKFAGRVGGTHDPLTLHGYAAHWRAKRHLPSMPNEADFDPAQGKLSAGEWIQRLVETVEIQAVLIEQLNQRLNRAGL